MKKKEKVFTLFAVALGFICSGCTSPGGLAPSSMPITARDSYTIVQREAYAIDSGVTVLIFPITTCSVYTTLQKVKEKYKADAIINVSIENINNCYVFWNVRKILIRGDAIKMKKSGSILE
jgi:hypothetical protein